MTSLGYDISRYAREAIFVRMKDCMPRFFFDIHDGKIVLDDVGTELGGLDEARDFARRMVIGLTTSMSRMRDAVQIRVNVRDAAGLRVLTGTLMFLIESTDGP